jgi:hypothetical protein
VLRRLAASLLIPLSGCGGHAAAARAGAPEPLPVRAPEAYASQREATTAANPDDLCKLDPSACPNLELGTAPAGASDAIYAVQQVSAPSVTLRGPLAGAPAARAFRSHRTVAQAVPPAPPATIPVKPAQAARVELFDIEAKVLVEVAELERAKTKLVELVRANGGQIMNEAVEDGSERRGAALSLRVPSERVQALLGSLGSVGKVRSSTLETKEVSRKIADAEVLIRNLESTLKRYEELLARAQNVAEATQIETQLARVRTQLDRVKADREWSQDRVARSTVYVTLALAEDHAPAEPEAALYPGLRAVFLVDVPPGSAGLTTTSYAGGGISLAWPRTFSIDLDLLTSLSDPGGGAIDFYFITAGTELYSDFLGGGRNRSFNPYLGLRAGFARGPGQSYFPLGGSVGVELYKSSGVLLALESRLYALIGRKAGPDFAVEPGLGLNFAY